MDTIAKVAVSGRKPPPVRGNRKGVPNKNTAALKDMILQALHNAGGAEYLERKANDPRTAAAFLGLIGKVLPMQVHGPGPNGEHRAQITVRFVTDAGNPDT